MPTMVTMGGDFQPHFYMLEELPVLIRSVAHRLPAFEFSRYRHELLATCQQGAPCQAPVDPILGGAHNWRGRGKACHQMWQGFGMGGSGVAARWEGLKGNDLWVGNDGSVEGG
jgi:hypothetical protein